MIVAKFGGSSVRDAHAFGRCLDIIRNNDYDLVVISATYNTTNELEDYYRKPSPEKSFKIIDRHKALAHELGISKKLSSLFFNKIRDQLKNCSHQDELLAQGELMSSFLLTEFLKLNLDAGAKCIDARNFIETDENYGMATPYLHKVHDNCKKLKSEKKLLITQGFIGANSQGFTTVLGREGSDYSATLFASALNAKEVHIWTDVPGVYSCDPRLVKDAYAYEYLSYEQASLMAENGAKVLFAKTLAPLEKQKIPLWVKSSLNSKERGTCISFKESFETACTLLNNNISIVGPHEYEESYEVVYSKENLTTFRCENAHDVIHHIHKKYSLSKR